MATAEKLSVSLPAEQARWIRRAARARKTTFSGLLSELIEEKRQHEEALAAFDDYFGKKGLVSSKVAERIRREWQED